MYYLSQGHQRIANSNVKNLIYIYIIYSMGQIFSAPLLFLFDIIRLTEYIFYVFIKDRKGVHYEKRNIHLLP